MSSMYFMASILAPRRPGWALCRQWVGAARRFSTPAGPSGPEPSTRLDGDERLVGARADLLHRPRVPVRVGEPEERPAVPLVEHRDLRGLHAAGEELRASRLGVGH